MKRSFDWLQPRDSRTIMIESLTVMRLMRQATQNDVDTIERRIARIQRDLAMAFRCSPSDNLTLLQVEQIFSDSVNHWKILKREIMKKCEQKGIEEKDNSTEDEHTDLSMGVNSGEKKQDHIASGCKEKPKTCANPSPLDGDIKETDDPDKAITSVDIWRTRPEVENKEEDGSADKGNFLNVAPSQIKYSQSSIKDTFTNGQKLSSTFQALLTEAIQIKSFPLMEVVRIGGICWALTGHRRLFLFKALEKAGAITAIKVIVRNLEDPEVKSTYGRRNTTTNQGEDIDIRSLVRNSVKSDIAFMVQDWQKQNKAAQTTLLKQAKEVKDLTVLQMTLLSLGIENVDGKMMTMVSCGSKIPTINTKLFTTCSNNQTIVAIQIYEGEKILTKDNTLIGKFTLTGIPLAPRGVPQIKVTIEITANGTLIVTACDQRTGRENKITIVECKAISRYSSVQEQDTEPLTQQYNDVMPDDSFTDDYVPDADSEDDDWEI